MMSLQWADPSMRGHPMRRSANPVRTTGSSTPTSTSLLLRMKSPSATAVNPSAGNCGVTCKADRVALPVAAAQSGLSMRSRGPRLDLRAGNAADRPC